ncbi:MAG: GerMN domain-containing protein [Oscillospiraceae bacterium]|nr:GerMN domain-containing protein [Oscillospiraceae bacterium]
MKVKIKILAASAALAVLMCGCAGKKADTAELTVFYGGEGSALQMEKTYVQSITPDTVLQSLQRRSVIPEGIQCNSFGISEPNENGRVTIYLDLTDKIARAMKRTGCQGERTMINAIVDTYLNAYDADEIVISVNGAELDSGRCRYSNPISMSGV